MIVSAIPSDWRNRVDRMHGYPWSFNVRLPCAGYIISLTIIPPSPPPNMIIVRGCCRSSSWLCSLALCSTDRGSVLNRQQSNGWSEENRSDPINDLCAEETFLGRPFQRVIKHLLARSIYHLIRIHSEVSICCSCIWYTGTPASTRLSPKLRRPPMAWLFWESSSRLVRQLATCCV